MTKVAGERKGKVPADYRDIVEWMRKTEDRGIFDAVKAGVFVTYGDAATEIERLRDENAALQRKLDEAVKALGRIATPMPGIEWAATERQEIALSALSSIRGEG